MNNAINAEIKYITPAPAPYPLLFYVSSFKLLGSAYFQNDEFQYECQTAYIPWLTL
ncbi:MAG: hypothetical protein QXF82_06620 [Nitrososphaeria archaeon]